MHYMSQPLSFRWDKAFIERIDDARGLIPRSAFVRDAVERKLEATSAAGDEKSAPIPSTSDARTVSRAASAGRSAPPRTPDRTAAFRQATARKAKA
jgi:hypothetical protein